MKHFSSGKIFSIESLFCYYYYYYYYYYDYHDEHLTKDHYVEASCFCNLAFAGISLLCSVKWHSLLVSFVQQCTYF